MITIQLTREEASELYIALSAAEAGFSPKNAVAAADSLNLLYPTVKALDKGKEAFNKAAQRIARDVRYKLLSQQDADERLEKLADELIVKTEEVVPLELHAIALTDEEITAAKLKPANLAILRRRLLEPKK